MIPGGWIATLALSVSALAPLQVAAPAVATAAEETPAFGQPKPMTTALLQLRANAADSAKEKGRLDQTLGGKCQTDCKQDKEINKLKANQGKGVKAFDKLVAIAAEVDNTLKENNKLLEDNTKKLTNAIRGSKKSWEEVNEELRIMIGDYKSGHATKFAYQTKEVDKTLQTVAAFFEFMKGKFVDMKDLIQYNKANVEDYLKSEAAKSQKSVKRLSGNVDEMKSTLDETMGTAKGAIIQKIKDSQMLNVGRVNAADEQVSASIEKINAKISSDRNEAHNVAKGLKQTKRDLQTMDKLANSLVAKERKNADVQLGKEQDDLRKTVSALKKEQKDKMKDLKGILGDVKSEVTTDVTEMAQNNMDAVTQLTNQMEAKAQQSADQIKEDQKGVFDDLMEKGATAEDVLAAVKWFQAQGEEELSKLEESSDEMNGDDNDAMKDLNAQWSSQYTELSRNEAAQAQELLGQTRENMKYLGGLSEEAQKNLTESLEAVAAKGDITSQNFDDSYAKLQNVQVRQFNDNQDWAKAMAADLAAFGITQDALGSETESQLASAEDQARNTEGLASKYAAGYATTIKDRLKQQSESVKAETEMLDQKMMQNAADSKAKFLSSIGELETQTDGSLADASRALGGLSQDYDTQQAGVVTQMSKNRAAEEAADKEVVELASEAEDGAKRIGSNMEKTKQDIARSQVEYSMALQQKTGQTREMLENEVKAAGEAQGRAVNAFVADTQAAMRRKNDDLSALEQSMRQGSEGFQSEADRSQQNLRNLQQAAGHLSAQVSADFEKARDALHASQLSADMTQEGIQKLMQSRADALQKLGTDRITEMDEDQQRAFNAAVAQREAKIQSILNLAGKTMEEKVAAINRVEETFGADLHELEAAATVTNDQVLAMHAEQEARMKGINDAITNVHNAEETTRILQADTAAQREQLLKERTEKLMAEIKTQTGGLDATLEGKISGVMDEANTKISAIMEKQHLTDEERREEIDKIDAATKHAIADLAAKQVALDNQLVVFETGQSEWGGAIGQQLNMLGGVLKDEQMKWLQGVLESKEELRKQTEDLTAHVDSLLGMLDSESTATAEEVDAQKAAARRKLAGVKSHLAEMAEQHAGAAADAMALAKLAEKAVAGEGHDVTEEISTVETSMTGASAALHKSDDETGAELSEERDARLKAMEEERDSAITETHALLDQISEVASKMSEAALISGDKQKALARKLYKIRTVLEEEAAKAKAGAAGVASRLEEGSNIVEQAAQKQLDWQRGRGERMDAFAVSSSGKLDALEAHQIDLEQAGQQGVKVALASAQGSIDREQQLAKMRAANTESEAASWIGAELHNANSYMQETSSEVQNGLAAQRQQVAALSEQASSRLKAEIRQDTALHSDVAAIGSKVSAQDAQLARLKSNVERQLVEVTADDDAQAREADREIAALRQQVAAGSLVEAPRQPHLAQARLQQLEAEVAASEGKTAKYEQENELMRTRLEAAVQKELHRQLN